VSPIRDNPAVAAEAPRAVTVRRLVLKEFRSFAGLRLALDDRPVVLTGPNGAGKTNLLEALSFLSPGQGLRGARLADLARQQSGSSAWAVAASVQAPGGAVEIGTGCEPQTGERRAVRIDGEPARSQSVLSEHLSVSWLTPQMDRLFLEGAAARRRFFDRLVFGHDPLHARRLAAYERSLRERSRLLRTGTAHAAWLDALEETIAGHGVAVAASRRETLARLQAAVEAGVGPFPGAILALEGAVEDWLETMPAVEAEERLRERLAQSRRQDAESGGAAEGPHRSDLAVTHAEKGMAAGLCSTGEQKALLIAMVFADARLRAVRHGAAPLLLLDEVVAHLDQRHRAALFEEVAALGAQAWCTGTEPALFAPFSGAAQNLTVADGAVAETRSDHAR